MQPIGFEQEFDLLIKATGLADLGMALAALRSKGVGTAVKTDDALVKSNIL